jgi:hypothetical protein
MVILEKSNVVKEHELPIQVLLMHKKLRDIYVDNFF